MVTRRSTSTPTRAAAGRRGREWPGSATSSEEPRQVTPTDGGRPAWPAAPRFASLVWPRERAGQARAGQIGRACAQQPGQRPGNNCGAGLLPAHGSHGHAPGSDHGEHTQGQPERSSAPDPAGEARCRCGHKLQRTGNGAVTSPAARRLAHVRDCLTAPDCGPQQRIGRGRIGERGRIPAVGPVRMRGSGGAPPGSAHIVVAQFRAGRESEHVERTRHRALLGGPNASVRKADTAADVAASCVPAPAEAVAPAAAPDAFAVARFAVAPFAVACWVDCRLTSARHRRRERGRSRDESLNLRIRDTAAIEVGGLADVKSADQVRISNRRLLQARGSGPAPVQPPDELPSAVH